MRPGKNGEKWPYDHAPEHAQAARRGWLHRRTRGDIAKFGGSAKHTEKTHYLKERKRAIPHKTAPKAPPSVSSFAEAGMIEVKGAKSEKGDTFSYLATQRADGRWIVSKRYKSGLVVQEKGTWATNPLRAKSNRRDAAYNLAHPDSGLFGGEYERKANGIKGLFE